MSPDHSHLTYLDLAIATALILVNIGLSLALRLDLARKWLVAGLRTVVQLLLIGYILEWVFAVNRWYVVVLLMAVMTLIAGHVSSGRSALKYPGMGVDGLISVWVSAWLVTAFGIFAVMRMDPWYDPTFSIPLLGIILGNVLTGVALGLERVTEVDVVRAADVLNCPGRRIHHLGDVNVTAVDFAGIEQRQQFPVHLFPVR